MHQHGTFGLVAAAVLLVLGSTARATETFSLAEPAAQLDGAAVTADTLLLGDYAQIVTSNGGTTFTDTGYLPVEGFSLAGQAVTPAGFNAPNGTGWGAYVQYTGSGTQTLMPGGIPASATYSQLSYQIVGYTGLATFGFDASGRATVGGSVSQLTPLAQGSLISGSLAFVPTSPTSISIEGNVVSTINAVQPQFTVGGLGTLDLGILHPPGEYAFTSPTTLQIAATGGASATLLASDSAEDPPDPVPEPASLPVVGAGLAALGALSLAAARRARQRTRRGTRLKAA